MSKKIALTANTSWYLYNFRKNTILALLDRGCEVVCIAPPDGYSVKLQETGARYIPIALDGASTNPFREIKTLFAALLCMWKERPDYVFNFTIKMNLYFGIVCRLMRIPYANNVSGLGTAFLYNNLSHRLAQYVYGVANRGADRVFFQNPDDMNLFIDKDLVEKSKASLLPGSGVDTKLFSLESMQESTAFIFTMVSRLIADKGVREFVAAAQRVKQQLSDVRFILVGAHNVSNKSAIQHEELALWKQEGIVELVGEQQNILPWLQQTHVLVLPSYREGMPKTVLEAGAVGRPSIVSNVSGCRHAVIDGLTGWHCEVQNVQSLADVMIHVHGQPKSVLEEYGRNARKMVEDSFREEMVVESYLNCLTNILK